MASQAASSFLAEGGPELGREKEKEAAMFGEEARASGAAQGARRAGPRGRHVPLPLVKVAKSTNEVLRGRGRSHL